MKGFVYICSWCGKIAADHRTAWQRFWNIGHKSHGICSKCLEIEKNKLRGN